MVRHAAESVFTGDLVSLVIGIVGSLLSLWILFSIKPSLRLTLEVGVPSQRWWKRDIPLGRIGKQTIDGWLWCSPKGLQPDTPRQQDACTREGCQNHGVHYRLEIENLGLAKAVEVEFRLRLIRKNETLGTRGTLLDGQLLELSGKWYQARREETEIRNHTGDRFFHVILPCAVSAEGFGNDDYYLAQVWSKHAFTNFGRAHRLRLRPNPSGDEFNRFAIEDPDARRRRRAVLDRVTTWLADAFPSRDVRKDRREGPGRRGVTVR
jgi:hypothetical protein